MSARPALQGSRSLGTWSSRTRAAEPEGRRWSITAVDAEGRRSTAERSFSLNNTLGFISVQPSRMTVGRKRGGRLLIGFTLTRPARVNVAIIQDGQLLRRAELRAPAGKTAVLWNGKYPNGKPVSAPTSPGSWRRTGSGGRGARLQGQAPITLLHFGAVPAASILSAITDALPS